jgi:hypothetical protein
MSISEDTDNTAEQARSVKGLGGDGKDLAKRKNVRGMVAANAKVARFHSVPEFVPRMTLSVQRTTVATAREKKRLGSARGFLNRTSEARRRLLKQTKPA